MHKTFLLILLFSISITSFSQKKDVSIKEFYSNKSLNLILIDLEIAYNLDIEYEKNLLKGITIESINIKSLDLSTTIRALLKDTNLDFELLGPRHVKIVTKVEKIREIYTPTRSNISVSGRVYDKNSLETLPYATAGVMGISSGAITNLDGYFTLLSVPSDTSTITIQFLGYNSQNISLNPELASADLEIYLSPIDYRIEEITVVGEEKKLMKIADKTSHISIRPAQIEMIPNLGEKDIFRTLQLMPGISSGNETSSGLYVRGGTPDQNLILYDGFTVYHVDHFFGFLSAFNADAVKDVQLYKGGFESKYGGKISSVMELTGKTGNKNKVGGGVSISALSANAFVEVPISDKLNFFIAGRRSYTDFIQSGLYKDINSLYESDTPLPVPTEGRGKNFAKFNTDPKFHFYDINAKATWNPNEKDVLSLSLYNGKDVLDKTNDMSSNFGRFAAMSGSLSLKIIDVMDWGNWGVSGKWSRQWNNRLYSNTTLAWSNYFNNRDSYREREVENEDGSISNTVEGFAENNNILDYTFRNDNEYRLNQNNTLEFGTQFTYNDVMYDYNINDSLSILNQANKGLISSAYLQDRLYLKDKLTLVYGLRSSHYDVTNEFYWEPRFSFSYQLSKKFKLKTSWGKYYQFTNRITKEDVLQGSTDFWLLADDETSPVSSAYHYIAGTSYETNSFLFDLEFYYKDMSGLSEFTLRNTGPREPTSMPEVFYTGDGYAKGFEVLLQKKYGKYTGWLGYTYNRVVHEFPDLYEGNEFYAIQDQPHEINFVNSFQWNNWVFGGTFVYITGKPYTAPIGSYELTSLDGTVMEYIHVGDKNGYRLPAYHRLDVSATYRFNIKNKKGSFGLSLYNLYGRKNIWYREFEVENDEIIIMDVNTLGFTPNIFFNFKF